MDGPTAAPATQAAPVTLQQPDAKPSAGPRDIFADLGIDPPKPISQLDTAIQAGAQGYSAGFGDEIMGGLTAPIEYAASRVMNVPKLSDMSLAEIYQHERDKI